MYCCMENPPLLLLSYSTNSGRSFQSQNWSPGICELPDRQPQEGLLITIHSYPTSGGLYYTVSRLAPKRYVAVVSWYTAWLNLLGQIAGKKGSCSTAPSSTAVQLTSLFTRCGK